MRKSAKNILRIGGIVALLVITTTIIHVVSALTVDRRVHYLEKSYSSAKVPENMHGYVIAFVADTHDMTDAELEAVVAQINARKIDLLLLGGDYLYLNAEPAMAILGKTQTTDGIFGVLGNHDAYKNLMQAMERNGMTFLYNNGLMLKPDFYLAGVSDLGTHKPRIHEALQNLKDQAFVLLLSHNPALVLEQDTSRVDLLLAGHTHGGHINLFGLWSPALAIRNPYGNRFRTGWHTGPAGTDILVTNGTGHNIGIPRVFAPPQVIFLTLHREAR